MKVIPDFRRLALSLMIGASLFGSPSLANPDEPAVLDVYSWDEEAGYWHDSDLDWFGPYATNNIVLTGDVRIDECRVSEDWGSGFRFRLTDGDMAVVIGVSCYRDNSALVIDTLLMKDAPGSEPIDSDYIDVEAALGVRHPFTMSVTPEKELIFSLGGETIRMPYKFQPTRIQAFGFCSKGEARLIARDALIG
ncbi:MAG: hypothetical protein CMK07_02650 [Ponticaulis sp.]|nr:hypothetical protein [Ponticaulis sp.]